MILTVDQLKWSECEAVWIDAQRLSGAPAFRQTRVPVSALFGNLRARASIEEFMDWFPGVSREQIDKVLEFVEQNSLAARR